MVSKKLLLRIFFAGEIIFFIGLYFVSPGGFTALQNKKQENVNLALSVQKQEQEVDRLKQVLHQWQQDTFYQEKVAREQLQMARPTDEVYYL